MEKEMISDFEQVLMEALKDPASASQKCSDVLNKHGLKDRRYYDCWKKYCGENTPNDSNAKIERDALKDASFADCCGLLTAIWRYDDHGYYPGEVFSEHCENGNVSGVLRRAIKCLANGDSNPPENSDAYENSEEGRRKAEDDRDDSEEDWETEYNDLESKYNALMERYVDLKKKFIQLREDSAKK